MRMFRCVQVIFLFSIAAIWSVSASIPRENSMFMGSVKHLAGTAQRAAHNLERAAGLNGKERMEWVEKAEQSLIQYDAALVDFIETIETVRQIKENKNSINNTWIRFTESISSELNLSHGIELSERIKQRGTGGPSSRELLEMAEELRSKFRPLITQNVTKELPVRKKKLVDSVLRVDSESVKVLSESKIRDVFKKAAYRSGTKNGRSRDQDYIDPGHPEIARQAQRLGYDPLNIYNYVRNAIAFEPYYGFRKAPESLVKGGKANSMDTAALTIALLRASGVECYFVTADIVMDGPDFLGWLGVPYATGDGGLINGLEFGAEVMNSLYPGSGNHDKTVIVSDPLGQHKVKVYNHCFVVANIDYVPSRGANRPGFAVATPDISGSGTPVPTVAYVNGDTNIPLDTSFKMYDLIYVPVDSPIVGPSWGNIWDGYSSPGNLDEQVDIVDYLLQEFMDGVGAGGGNGGRPVSAIFDSVPGKKIRIETEDYLPNSLPYQLLDEPDSTFIVFGDDSIFNESELFSEVVINFCRNVLPMPSNGASPVEGGEEFHITVDELAEGRLTVGFRLDDNSANDEYFDALQSGQISNIFEFAGMTSLIGRPSLFLNGESLTGISPPIDSSTISDTYYLYISVQDTKGNWISIENQVNYGEMYSIVPFFQTIDDDQDLQIIDNLNSQLLTGIENGQPVSRIDPENGYWNIDYWSQYLNIQGRHYFKQQSYSEEIIAGMTGSKVIRDVGVIRVGITFDGILIGDTSSIVDIDSLASFCDLDLYQVNFKKPAESVQFPAFDTCMNSSSSAEHELFYRETENFDSIVSAAKLIRQARENGITIGSFDPSSAGQYINEQDFDDLGQTPLMDCLRDQFMLYGDSVSDGHTCSIECPLSFFECVSPDGRNWIGTGYKITISDGSGSQSMGYMIYGTFIENQRGPETIQTILPREYGGGLGLTGTPRFFDNIFGFEFEAVYMQQQNLTLSEDHEIFRRQWESEYMHWLTLGAAKEFRWRFRTYSYKTGHYRQILCADPYCMEGRPWIRALIWDGPGRLCDEQVPYLVTIFRGDDEPVEAINFYNMSNDMQYYYQPFQDRPTPVPCPDLGLEVVWYERNPWYYSEYEPSNFPTFDWPELQLDTFQSEPWLTVFFGADTASFELYNSVKPRVWIQNTPTPVSSPQTPLPGTPIPGVGRGICDGFVAHMGQAGSFPDYNNYKEKWLFTRAINNGEESINSAVKTCIPYCDPQFWPSDTGPGNEDLGALIFGSGYRTDPEFQNWNINTDNYSLPPEMESWWVHLMDNPNGCDPYMISGHTTHCERMTPTPLRGLCPLDNCDIYVKKCAEINSNATPCASQYTMEDLSDENCVQSILTPNPDSSIYGDLPWIAKFDIDCSGEAGMYQMIPVHKDDDGRIDYAVEGSEPPDMVKPWPTQVLVGFGNAYTPIPAGELYLEHFPSGGCYQGTPVPGMYLDDQSYIPDHFRKDAIDSNHPQYPLGAGDGVDLVTRRLNISEPVINIPLMDGSSFVLNRFYNSKLTKRFTSSLLELSLRNDGGLGLGWEMHPGKVTISRGDLPLIYGADGSVRTAYFDESCDYHFSGPFYTRDGWRLDLLCNGGACNMDSTIHDDDVTAQFTSPDGTVFVCNQRKSDHYGICPYNGCDDWSYTWFVTEVKAVNAVTLLEIDYDIEIDYYNHPIGSGSSGTPTATPTPGPYVDYYREIPVIRSISYDFPEGNHQTIDILHSQFNDNNELPDAPPRIESILHQNDELVSFNYLEQFTGQFILQSATHQTGVNPLESSPLTIRYDYYPGSLKDIATGELQTGLLKNITVPTGGKIEYFWDSQIFENNEYDSDAVIRSVNTTYPVLLARHSYEDEESVKKRILTLDHEVGVQGEHLTTVRECADSVENLVRQHRYYWRLTDEDGCYQTETELLNPADEVLKRTTYNSIDPPVQLPFGVHPCYDANYVIKGQRLENIVETEYLEPSTSRQKQLRDEDRTVATEYSYQSSITGFFLEQFLPTQVTIKDVSGDSIEYKQKVEYTYQRIVFPELSNDDLYTVFLPENTYLHSDPVNYVETSYTYWGQDNLLTLPETVTVNGLRYFLGYENSRFQNQIINPDGTINSTNLVYNHSEIVSTSSISDPDHIETYVSSMTMNQLGHVKSYTDINSKTTKYTSDLLGRTLSVTAQDSGLFTANTRYPSSTEIITGINNNRRTETVLDKLGRVQRISSQTEVSPRGRNQVYYRDSLGNVTNSSIAKPDMEDPLSPGGVEDNPYFYDYTYDVFNRPLTIHDPVALNNRTDNPTEIVYSPFSTRIIDPTEERATTVYRYDAVGRLIEVNMPDLTGGPGSSQKTEYSYDWLGKLKSVRQSSGLLNQERQFDYNSDGKLIYENHPETGSVRYTYDTEGYRNLIMIEYADGSYTTVNGYDFLNRPLSKTFYGSDGYEDKKVEYIYDDHDPVIPGYSLPSPVENCRLGNITAVKTYRYEETGGWILDSAIVYPDYTRLGAPVAKTLIIPDEDPHNTVEMTANFSYDYTSSKGYGDLTEIKYTGTAMGVSIPASTVQYAMRKTSGTLERVTLNGETIASEIRHDHHGGLSSMKLGCGVKLSAGYNNGNIMDQKVEGNLVFDYSFNEVNHIVQVEGPDQVVENYDYDTWGRLEKVITRQAELHSRREYDYDSLNNLTGTRELSNGVVIQEADFEYQQPYLIGAGIDPGDEFESYLFQDEEWSPAASAGLAPRTGFAMSAGVERGTAVLFGGELIDVEASPTPSGPPVIPDDTWIFQGEHWEELGIAGPEPRRNHAMCYHPGTGHVVMFGGEILDIQPEPTPTALPVISGDTWFFDGQHWENASIAAPPIVDDPVLAQFEETIVLITGTNTFNMYFLERNQGTWYWASVDTGSGDIPSKGETLQAVWHPPSNQLVVVDANADTFVYNSSDGWVRTPYVAQSDPPSLTLNPADQSICYVTGDGDSSYLYSLMYDGASGFTGWIEDDLLGIMRGQSLILQGIRIPLRSQAYEFDGKGRRTSDDASIYEWNAADEIVRIYESGTSNERAHFKYDGSGKRVNEVWNDSGDGETSIYRLYLGEEPVFEIQLAGQKIIRRRVYARGEGRLLATADYPAGSKDMEVRYYLQDHLGSMISQLDAEGDKLWPETGVCQRYKPYGGFEGDAGDTGYDIPSFTGKFADPGTGNHYFNARYHSSDHNVTGGPMQFTSPDPIYGNLADPLSWNRYTYCHNNPINMIDPDGRAFYGFDGTNNDKDNPEKGNPTNVAALYNSYPGTAYYYEGVGTGDTIDYVTGGFSGTGGHDRLSRAYSQLVETYNSGDTEIVIVGFSRGAALARAFANIIAKRGIPVSGGVVVRPKIQFLGLFDTVGSFYMPGDNDNGSFEMGIPDNVETVRHATAENEYRHLFPLSSIHSSATDQNTARKIEKGFVGAHSDIGGGYDDNRLSLAPLLWMHSEANGLFGPLSLNFNGMRHTGPSTIHDSRTFMEKIFPRSRKVYYQ